MWRQFRLPNSNHCAGMAQSACGLRFLPSLPASHPRAKDERSMSASTGPRPSTGQASDDQWLFTKSDLSLTPSVLQGGLDPVEEKQRRFKGVNAIYRMGEYMRLPQHVMNTAAIYLHRFFMRKPLEYGPSKLGHSHYDMAATCVFLACKVEESHRKLPSVIDAAMASFDKSPAGAQRWAERTFRADPSSKVRSRCHQFWVNHCQARSANFVLSLALWMDRSLQDGETPFCCRKRHCWRRCASI